VIVEGVECVIHEVVARKRGTFRVRRSDRRQRAAERLGISADLQRRRCGDTRELDASSSLKLAFSTTNNVPGRSLLTRPP
jgi:hypothetical protein